MGGGMIKIKNWQRFQHYTNRKPSWIKLYRDLLDDPEWAALDGNTAKILVMLWLLAAEGENGGLPDNETIAFRLRKSTKDINAAISKLCHWLVQDASNPLAAGYQDASLEREREKEKEREEIRLQPGGQQAGSVPDAVIAIPLIPSHGEYGISQNQVDQWAELFPGVQVMQTLREIKAWNVANPSRRKTRRGIEKHVVGWLSREQNKA